MEKNPNVLGYVTSYIEDRTIVNGTPGPVQVLLKLKLKNTVGQVREILVPGPADLSDFFSPERIREDMTQVIVGG